jgi:hypothetical protein
MLTINKEVKRSKNFLLSQKVMRLENCLNAKEFEDTPRRPTWLAADAKRG